LPALFDPIDGTYQRRMNRQLTVQESRHRLGRKICHGNRGQIRQAYREGQEDRLAALGLVLNAVVLWNTRYLDTIIEHLRGSGQPVHDEDVARLSPLGHAHLNCYLDKLQTCYVAGPAGSAARLVSVMPRHRPQSFVVQKAGSVELMFARSGSSGSPGSSSRSVGDQAPMGMGVTWSSAA
jgi:hypothetical protein